MEAASGLKVKSVIPLQSPIGNRLLVMKMLKFAFLGVYGYTLYQHFSHP